MNKMTLTKFHQSAFVIRSNDVAWAFDFGSEVPDDVVTNVGHVSAVFVSHSHPDHLHVPHVRRFGAPTHGPPDVCAILKEQGIMAIPIRSGDTTVVDGLQVSAFRADHGPNISAPIDNLGFVSSLGGRSVLYLGDTAVPIDPPAGHFDMVLIPVGGSKVFSPEDAVAYLRRIDYRKVVVPIHYHGRADRQAGEKFRMLAGDLCQVKICDVGQTLEV